MLLPTPSTQVTSVGRQKTGPPFPPLRTTQRILDPRTVEAPAQREMKDKPPARLHAQRKSVDEDDSGTAGSPCTANLNVSSGGHQRGKHAQSRISSQCFPVSSSRNLRVESGILSRMVASAPGGDLVTRRRRGAVPAGRKGGRASAGLGGRWGMGMGACSSAIFTLFSPTEANAGGGKSGAGSRRSGGPRFGARSRRHEQALRNMDVHVGSGW